MSRISQPTVGAPAVAGHCRAAPFASAAAAPLVRFGNTAGQHSVIRFEALAGDDEPELIESAEGGQISAARAAGGSGVLTSRVAQQRCAMAQVVC
jgi:hypothetical protein